LGGVFINYRGEDSELAAALIDRELTARFGDGNVFLDCRSIPAGTDFEKELLGRLERCTVLLVVIGPRWLTLTDEAGRRRIDDRNDWIRREVTAAFANHLHVIPVLTDEARLPAETELPRDIAGLARRQYVPLRRRYSRVDLAYLVERILEVDNSLVDNSLVDTAAKPRQYDVVLSYAPAQREYAQETARRCQTRGMHVLCEELCEGLEQAYASSANLAEHLDWVYSRAARYCVVFVSAEYARKTWARPDWWQSVRGRVLARSDFLVPAVFDETRMPGLPTSTSYVDARRSSPEELASMLGQRLTAKGDPESRPANVVNSVSGVVHGDVLQAGDLTISGNLVFGSPLDRTKP
jgi:TIR domain